MNADLLAKLEEAECGDDEFADEETDLTEDCGRWDNGLFRAHCALAGTEFCDWDCPDDRPRPQRKPKPAPLFDAALRAR